MANVAMSEEYLMGILIFRKMERGLVGGEILKHQLHPKILRREVSTKSQKKIL